jgi:uncharacterized iron-regulated membrane protein
MTKKNTYLAWLLPALTLAMLFGGVIAMAAFISGLEAWLNLHALLAVPIGLVLFFMFPFIGIPLGIYATVAVWGWAWMAAFFIFMLPVVAILAIGIGMTLFNWTWDSFIFHYRTTVGDKHPPGAKAEDEDIIDAEYRYVEDDEIEDQR